MRTRVFVTTVAMLALALTLLAFGLVKVAATILLLEFREIIRSATAEMIVRTLARRLGIGDKDE